MWNWLRTLTESDKRRLRKLERLTDDLAADVTLLTERVVRSEARLRARARRALESEPTPPEPGQGDDVGLPGVALQGGVQPEQLNGEADRTATREVLRERFRAKFGGRQA